ncbi:DUF433 domain-containing protein [Candidatus Woesearchaeota archaeon]|nr:DUF433 domain-containing protein [Candidatus Woesearchaeota archaeon]
MDFMKRIIVDPKIMVGKPVIKGTRVPVDAILQRIADGMTTEGILKDYPNLTKDDVRAAVEYSASLVRGEDIIPEIEEKKAAYAASG